MKNILNISLLVLFLCTTINLSAQLKVKTDGSVKIGSESPWPSGGKLEITGVNETLEARVFVGSANIARYWAINSVYGYGFGIDGNGIGSIYRNIHSPYPIMSFNSSGNFSIGTSSVYSSYRLYIYGNFRAYGEVTCRDGYWASSDMRMKSNILPIDGALNKVMNLNGKTYNLKSSSLKSSEESNKTHYGLIAQEVKEIVPELVKETEDSISSLAINYDGLIPVLIEAIKEQQITIDALKTEVENLKVSSSISNVEEQNIISKDKLFQNAPNPFNKQTTIKYSLNQNANNTSIIVYNMQGSPVKNISINGTGEGEITINASELKPGMYMYSLISDGKLIDTKTMLLTD